MSVIDENPSAPITDQAQLIADLAAGNKPKARWRIGTEHEKFVARSPTHELVSYAEPAGIRDLLQAMQKFGWQPLQEGQTIIGLTRAGAGISLEPAGQFELSGAPLDNIHETAQELSLHLMEVAEAGAALNLSFYGLGHHPTALREEMPWMPKGRYQIMRQYMPKVGSLGLDMMTRTCTVQVNLDYADEADFIQKFRVATALSPLATALFAASPFTAGKPNQHQSWRMRIWQDTDPARSGLPLFCFNPDFGFARYVEYALDVPMYFVYRQGRYYDMAGQSFRTFMAGDLPGLAGERPTLTDWRNHLTTCFPDVRAKQFLEMRSADASNQAMLNALPAFWVGLLYDQTTLDAASELAKGWSPEALSQLHDAVPRLGLRATLVGRPLLNIARDVLKLAQQGLRRRARRLHGGADESLFLEPLEMIVETGQSVADDWLNAYQNSWKGDISPIFAATRLA